MKTINDIKKELYRNKPIAKLTRVIKSTMYYTIELEDGAYQFPIETVEPDGDKYVLSADLGTTSFEAEMKASELIRWISKAMEKNELVKI